MADWDVQEKNKFGSRYCTEVSVERTRSEKRKNSNYVSYEVLGVPEL